MGQTALTDRDLERLNEESIVLANKALKNGTRNAFACAALTGLLADARGCDPTSTARYAFTYADAMLAESEKQ